MKTWLDVVNEKKIKTHTLNCRALTNVLGKVKANAGELGVWESPECDLAEGRRPELCPHKIDFTFISSHVYPLPSNQAIFNDPNLHFFKLETLIVLPLLCTLSLLLQ